jgi:hypothetical protein
MVKLRSAMNSRLAHVARSSRRAKWRSGGLTDYHPPVRGRPSALALRRCLPLGNRRNAATHARRTRFSPACLTGATKRLLHLAAWPLLFKSEQDLMLLLARKLRRARGECRLPLSGAAKSLKRLKTAMGGYWKKLAWIWVWRHVGLGLAPRRLGLDGTAPTVKEHRALPMHLSE